MSRWKSPQVAAKHAERAAKESEQLRKIKRNSSIMIIGLGVVIISLIIADYFWLKSRAQKHRAGHLQRLHQPAQTNSSAATVLGAGKTNSTEAP